MRCVADEAGASAIRASQDQGEEMTTIQRIEEIREQTKGSTAGMHQDVEWLIEHLEKAIEVIKFYAKEAPYNENSMNREFKEKADTFLEELKK